MKRKTVFYALSLLVLSCMAFTFTKWILVESKEFGYSLEFPGKAVPQSQSINTEAGALELNMYIYDASNAGDDNLLYLSNCTEYPDGKVDLTSEESINIMYRNAIDGAVKNVQGDLRSEKEVSISGHNGREVVVGYLDGAAMITMQILIIKNRMYMLQTIAEKTKFPNKSTEHFFGSFKLKKKL